MALVGVFISVGTFTQKAAADTASSVQDACTITEEIGQPFENPPFAYADKGPITLSANQSDFQLGQPEYKGYLYQATYYDANGKLVEEDKPKYTPPTIVVSPDNSIDLTLTNNLPPKIELTGQIPKTEENIQKQSQDTNIHYHGFNVSPLLGSDDVVMHVHSKMTPNPINSSEQKNLTVNTHGDIYPGDVPESPKYGSIAEYRMRVNLPKGHQSGLFWYHPHAHTVSNNQVRAGMSGGIIVNGIEESYRLLDPKDGIKRVPMLYTDRANENSSGNNTDDSTKKQPNRLAITQQVMLFKDFNDVLGTKNDVLGTKKVDCFTLNGQVKPKITILPGEVQLWRIGNIGADEYLNLALKKLPEDTEQDTEKPFYILARDGNVVNEPINTDSILLPPASRVELLVVGGESGQNYDLVSQSSSEATTYEGILATVKVGEQIVTYLCPDGSPLKSCTPDQSGKIVDYITSQTPAKVDDILPEPSELANYEECKDSGDHTKCITPGDEYSDPLTQKRTFTFNTAQLGGNTVFTINGKLYDENRIDKVSHLGDIEEWQVLNKTGKPHAFHMHQLDFLVTKVILENKDKPTGDTYDNYKIVAECKLNSDDTVTCLKPQGYRDTINLPPNSTTTIRIPFLNPFITGVFVYHCHILDHEDKGMMQNLKVIDPKNYKSTSGLVSNS